MAVIEFTTLTIITYLFKFMAESARGDTTISTQCYTAEARITFFSPSSSSSNLGHRLTPNSSPPSTRMITPSFVMKNSFKNFQTHLLHILSVLASITSHRWFVVITVDAIKTVVIARSRLYAPFTEASTQSLWRKPRRFIEGSW
ncbi:hypothetical protein V6N11_044753 [Hibiscus sabdariffa]|uniref:Uncharacterized protein n=1 Tax=Hibiscus sabdariffa TaxID=183260 RepID=A0ABR2PTV4_9ROSI